ncbi:type VI secretion protein, partial [Escherichia coli]|nr:type VI secretion protein [Escherichia coli]
MTMKYMLLIAMFFFITSCSPKFS